VRSKIAAIIVPFAAGALTLFLLCRPEAPYRVPAKHGIRIATYNMEFLTEKISPERKANLQSVIRNIRPDILAAQEVESRAALKNVLGDEWQIGIADLAKEPQKLAIAVRAPCRLLEYRLLFPSASLDDPFPGGRDVLRAVVQSENLRLVLYVVHYKSRSGGRRLTDPRRAAASRILLNTLRAHQDENQIVLGDFNDTPDDRALKILETGDPDARPESDAKPGFLFNTCGSDWAEDVCTLDLYHRARGSYLDPHVRGARKDNNRLRGIEYRYPADVRVREIMFDQILVSPRLRGLVRSSAFVYTGADAVNGLNSVVVRTGSGRAEVRLAGSLASDHVPVFIDLSR
jgi:endonuclease/exonuclease/phosphatase family metal-dependent hydrolase